MIVTFVLCSCDLDEGLLIELLEKVPGSGRNLNRLHQLSYLLKADGIPFTLTFDLNGRGPYSYRLEDKLLLLAVDGVLSTFDKANGLQIIDTKRAAHIAQSSGSQKHGAEVSRAVDRWSQFDDRQLELLSTVHYVKASGNLQRDDDQVVRTMQFARGNRFSESDIRWALHQLGQAVSPDTCQLAKTQG